MEALAQYGSDSDDDHEETRVIEATKSNIGALTPVMHAESVQTEELGDSKSTYRHDFFSLDNESDSNCSEDDSDIPLARKAELNTEVPSTGLWKDFQPVVSEISAEELRRQSRPTPKSIWKPTPVPFVSAGVLNSQDSETADRKVYFVHHLISQNMNRESHSRPRKQELVLSAHAGVVNRVRWCHKKDYSHLAATASADSTVKLWNFFTNSEQSLGVICRHEKAATSLSWSASGRNLLSGSYDRSALITDVERKTEISKFMHSNHVTKVEYNPTDHRLFVTISRDVIYAWDLRRTNKPYSLIRHPRKGVTSFFDLAHINDSQEIMVSTDCCEHNLCVFDVRTGGVLSSEQEMFPERYTCPRLLASRRNGCVLAQTQGDYICEFSTKRPFKLNRTKRFGKHKVSGWPVGLDLSCDGRTVVSGSAESAVHMYDWSCGRAVGSVVTGLGVCTDVACHPVMGNVVLVASWDGRLALIK